MTITEEVRFQGTARMDGTVLFDTAQITLVSGGWTCLLGQSGVGKSTILRLIAGLETGADFDGKITSGGLPLDRTQISYMAQDDLLLPWRNVLGNVTLGAQLRGARADLARAHDLIDQLGLNPHIEKRPAALSGGQRQRVALARTLMEDRPVVLLDEPFSALDARTRADMQDLAAKVLRHATVLLVTHDPGEAARLGDQIIVMRAGDLEVIPPPPGAAIRPLDDPETLAYQARLLGVLRKGP